MIQDNKNNICTLCECQINEHLRTMRHDALGNELHYHQKCYDERIPVAMYHQTCLKCGTVIKHATEHNQHRHNVDVCDKVLAADKLKPEAILRRIKQLLSLPLSILEEVEDLAMNEIKADASQKARLSRVVGLITSERGERGVKESYKGFSSLDVEKGVITAPTIPEGFKG